MRFWDASALVPLVREEPRSRVLRMLHERDDEIIVWWRTRLECISTLMRLVRESRIESSAEIDTRERLDALLEAAEEIEATWVVRERAERLLAIHPLGAADALQLAAALIWAREHPAHLGFVCLDAQLRRAAGREGFSILPADRHLT